jgi:hypothetical protein
MAMLAPTMPPGIESVARFLNYTTTYSASCY